MSDDPYTDVPDPIKEEKYRPDIRSCDVCHKEGEVFVHSSSFAAYSFASCLECLRHYAEPSWVFEWLRDWVDTPAQNQLREEVYNECYTYWNDQYIVYKDWLKQNPYDRERFEQQLKEFNDALAGTDIS